MRTKVVFVGAGSFVFGPSMLSQALLENRMSGLELVLADPNLEVAEPMATLGRRMASEAGVDASVFAEADYRNALGGADFVISCAAVQMNRRFAMDREIIEQAYPEHLISEFGGVHGISYSLRQLTFARELAREMRDRCPRALLLNVANPLPRVCQMAAAEGIETIGFCSVSLSGYGKLSEVLDGESEGYPYANARAKYRTAMGGTNHLSWLVELRDGEGKDQMSRLRARLEERMAPSKCEAWGRKTGYLLMSGDQHVQDFLRPEGLEQSISLSSHLGDTERQQRLGLLKDAATGEASWEPLLAHPAWERPMDLVWALRGGPSAKFESLNLANGGQISELPIGAFVETAAVADSKGVRAVPLDLPDAVLPYSRLAVKVNELLGGCRAGPLKRPCTRRGRIRPHRSRQGARVGRGGALPGSSPRPDRRIRLGAVFLMPFRAGPWFGRCQGCSSGRGR